MTWPVLILLKDYIGRLTTNIMYKDVMVLIWISQARESLNLRVGRFPTYRTSFVALEVNQVSNQPRSLSFKNALSTTQHQKKATHLLPPSFARFTSARRAEVNHLVPGFLTFPLRPTVDPSFEP